MTSQNIYQQAFSGLETLPVSDEIETNSILIKIEYGKKTMEIITQPEFLIETLIEDNDKIIQRDWHEFYFLAINNGQQHFIFKKASSFEKIQPKYTEEKLNIAEEKINDLSLPEIIYLMKDESNYDNNILRKIEIEDGQDILAHLLIRRGVLSYSGCATPLLDIKYDPLDAFSPRYKEMYRNKEIKKLIELKRTEPLLYNQLTAKRIEKTDFLLPERYYFFDSLTQSKDNPGAIELWLVDYQALTKRYEGWLGNPTKKGRVTLFDTKTKQLIKVNLYR